MNPRAMAFYGVLLFYGMMNAVHQIYLFWLAEEKLNSPTFVLGKILLEVDWSWFSSVLLHFLVSLSAVIQGKGQE